MPGTTIQIELLTAGGCSRCTQLRDRIMAVTQALGDPRIRFREVDVIEQIDYAVSLGVLSTPAVVIDGRLVFSGAPSESRLRAAIRERLNWI